MLQHAAADGWLSPPCFAPHAAAAPRQIWKLVKSPEVIAREGKGLTRHRFSQVLRLIALAQSGSHPFTQENATAALHAASWMALHSTPLPPPRLTAAEAQAAAAGAVASQPPQQQQEEQQQEQQPCIRKAGGSKDLRVSFDNDLLGLAADTTPAAAAAVAAAGEGAAAYHDDDDLFGLSELQQRAASHGATIAAPSAPGMEAAPLEGEGSGLGRRLSRSIAVSQRDSHRGGLVRVHTGEGVAAQAGRVSGCTAACAACLHAHPLACCAHPGCPCRPRAGKVEPPVAFVARLPPLQPKVSAKLTMLAAGNGSLFAGPAVNGGLLQWGRPEGNMRRPLDVEGHLDGQPVRWRPGTRRERRALTERRVRQGPLCCAVLCCRHVGLSAPRYRPAACSPRSWAASCLT